MRQVVETVCGNERRENVRCAMDAEEGSDEADNERRAYWTNLGPKKKREQVVKRRDGGALKRARGCVQATTKFDRSVKNVNRGWVGKKNRLLRAVSIVSVEISVAKGCSKPIRKLTHRRVRVKASRARWAEHLCRRSTIQE